MAGPYIFGEHVHQLYDRHYGINHQLSVATEDIPKMYVDSTSYFDRNLIEPQRRSTCAPSFACIAD